MAVSLLDIKGVGPTLARLLTEAGFADLSAVASAQTNELTNIAGIGERTASMIQSDAVRLLADQPAVGDQVGVSSPSRRKKAKKLRKQAKHLQGQAKLLAKKAEKTKSKKKRKQRLRLAAQLQAAAKRKRRKAKKLLAG